MQEIWSEIVVTLKSQYDGLKGGSDGVEINRERERELKTELTIKEIILPTN